MIIANISVALGIKKILLTANISAAGDAEAGRKEGQGADEEVERGQQHQEPDQE
jgi:hypothetical protein